MKFVDFWKNHKAFIVCVLVVVLFFLVLMADNHFKLYKLERDYEKQIEELKKLIPTTEAGEVSDFTSDVCETVNNFLDCYYGVSPEMPRDYREEKLKELMTEDAYIEYGGADYDNTQNYTITLDDMYIYTDYGASEMEVNVCVFYNENINWPEINTITLRKYWRGTFIFDYALQQWLLSDITDCQELLTREEFNALNADTNGDVYEESAEEGGAGNADSEEKEQETSE